MTIRPKVNCVLAFYALLVLAACSSSGSGDGVSDVFVETLVPGTPLHGITGLSWGPDNMLYAAAMSGQTVSRIDPKSGKVETLVPPPHGESDDVAVGPDGTLVWTAMFAGELRVKRPDGTLDVLATDVVGINPVAFSPGGRLFAVVMDDPNRLYEYDVENVHPPRLVTDQIKKLNSFEIGTDGYLYGPFWLSGELVKLNLETGAYNIIASGLGEPSAVELDSRGNLISGNFYTGEVHRTDPSTGVSTLIAALNPPLDNLAVGSDDTIYVSDSASSGVYVIAPDGTVQDRLVGGAFTIPGGLAIQVINGRETLLVADNFGYRLVDMEDGTVTRAPFTFDFGTGMDLATSGRLMAMTDARIGRVHIFDRSTQTRLHQSTDFESPYGIVFLPNDDVLIADYGNGRLVRWNGTEIHVITDRLSGPVGLALESPSSVLVTEHTAGQLTRVDLSTGHATSLFDGLVGPEGVAVATGGQVVVAEAGASRIVVLDVQQSTRRILAEDLDLAISILRAPEDVGFPTGVAVAQDGTVYVSEAGTNAILKIVGAGL